MITCNFFKKFFDPLFLYIKGIQPRRADLCRRSSQGIQEHTAARTYTDIHISISDIKKSLQAPEALQAAYRYIKIRCDTQDHTTPKTEGHTRARAEK